MLPKELYISYFLTGSSYICNPPVLNTDIDYMYYVYDIGEVEEWLKDNDWKACSRQEYFNDVWSAWRKGNYNLLLTPDKEYYDKFEAATELAKKRNLLNKKDRVALFKRICHNDNVFDVHVEEEIPFDPVLEPPAMPDIQERGRQYGNTLRRELDAQQTLANQLQREFIQQELARFENVNTTTAAIDTTVRAQTTNTTANRLVRGLINRINI